jgi:serine/threonine-protein kinase
MGDSVTTRDLRVSTKQQPPEPGELRGSALQGELKLVRLIGSGGMGQVWEAASDDLPGGRLAVKVVAAEHAKDPATVARFFGEARAASAIDDPNILKIYGTGRTEDGRPSLVMPYVEGQSLADICDERGRLPVDMAGKILLQLASALRAAHEVDIVHRDIKPPNVMVMPRRWGIEWFVILVDFGICKFRDKQMAGNIHSITAQYIGTPGYSAPEQLHGRPVTAKADIYALGVLAYRILCGRTPYIGDSYISVMTQQCDPRASFPEPQDLRPDIPREWNNLIILCLERDPARRPSPSEFGRWIAAGMQNGASMLTSLAPQIAAETRAAPNEATISSDVPTALAQIQALARRHGSRRTSVAALVTAALAGALVTAVSLKLASSTQQQPEAQPRTPVGESRQASSQTPMPPAPDARPQTSAAAEPPTDGTHAAVRSESAVAASDSKPHPGTETGDVARAGSATAPDGPRARTTGAVNAPSASEAARSRRATGTLEIRAKTWADCFLSDGGPEISLGTAPVTVNAIAVGKHRVRCRNEGQRKDETDTVTIDAAKVAVLEKNW